jgi:hypothetical protein
MPNQDTPRLFPILAGLTVLASLPADAQNPYFVDNFNTDTSALWTVNRASANSIGNFATFAFDYSTIGIPAAPGSGGTTRGLKLEANVTGGIQTGLSVSPTGLALPNEYILTFNLWHNFPGPLPGGGSGSTQISGAGVGTAGTIAQWAGGPTYDSVFFGASGDGGSSIDYRVYAVGNTAGAATGYYAAGTGGTPDPRNESHPYYSSFQGAVPAEQTALFPSQQSGSTATGAQGFEWHDVVIRKAADSITWSIDGVTIATVPTAGLTLGGNNILLNHYDINNAVSADPNARQLLFGLFDNVVVSQIPEPSATAIIALAGGAATLFRRRSSISARQ